MIPPKRSRPTRWKHRRRPSPCFGWRLQIAIRSKGGCGRGRPARVSILHRGGGVWAAPSRIESAVPGKTSPSLARPHERERSRLHCSVENGRCIAGDAHPLAFLVNPGIDKAFSPHVTFPALDTLGSKYSGGDRCTAKHVHTHRFRRNLLLLRIVAGRFYIS